MAAIIFSTAFVVPGVVLSAVAGRSHHGSLSAWWNRHSN